MSYERLLRPLLFRLEPETAHNTALWCIARGVVRSKLVVDSRLERTVFGVRFANPVGLAAGFDKSGVALNRWQSLGFGFAEVGTVTPLPQAGNPRPRLFRLINDKALINRFGFNNDGAKIVSERLIRAQRTIPIGANIGKNRETPDVDAPRDYRAAYDALAPLADYVAINVSSPNTPGLRSLQDRGALSELLAAIADSPVSCPVLVKISPDLSDAEVAGVLGVCVDRGVAGIVATNTTTTRSGLKAATSEAGGLSGAPLSGRSCEVLALLNSGRPPGLALISVGGIFTPEDARHRLEAGADLIQIYTGWVYGGPSLVPSILLELLREPAAKVGA